jgi:hypothetical protein
MSWPSVYEGLLLTVCLWCFRGVERILGSGLLCVFLLYNGLVFVPCFIGIIFLRGFISHFSLFYFVPYSLYIFTLWEIPTTPVVRMLSDKVLISALLITAASLRLPYSLIPLGTGVIGNVLWSFDAFWLKHLCRFGENVVSEEVGVETEEPLLGGEVDAEMSSEHIKAITEMGFTDAQARRALRDNENNLERAVDSLLAAA